MDSERVDDWREQADRLLDAASERPRAGLAQLLAHIGEGVRLRRPLDLLNPGGPTEACRRAIVRRLRALVQAVDHLLDQAGPERNEHTVLASQVENWLEDSRLALRKLLVDRHLTPLSRALGVEGMRGELDWLSSLVARLDGERAPSRIAHLEIEIDRVRNELTEHTASATRPDPELDRLIGRCERLRGILLERRVRRELERSTAEMVPERLLAMRMQLSRSQSRVEALEPVEDGDGRAYGSGGDPRGWAEALTSRRLELARRAVGALEAMSLAESRRPCERAVQTAQDDISEMIAFVEDLPPRCAVKRLELTIEDLSQLILILRGLKSGARPGEPEPSGEADAREDLSRELRVLRRLRWKVRGEWQEKTLTMRLGNLLGARSAKLLEELVLWLILVLVGLIAAESFLDHTDWMSDDLHAWFAWADLAICSVLLGEFALRLALAPGKGTYLLRHFVIDFFASLPFGFLSYQLATADVEGGMARAAESLFWLSYLRLGRLIQLVRSVRVGLPVVRLARFGLFLLRLGDRLIRKQAALLNRNIVLFELYHAQHPESRERHQFSALRSEYDQARAQTRARLDHAAAALLAGRVLEDLHIRIGTLPAETFDGEDEGGGGRAGREIPVEALVDQMIQLSPERLVDRMGPGFVTSADRYLRLLDAPGFRRLPVIRNLVAYRQKSPAEAVALAANYVGHLIQRLLEVVYFLADLQGTLSPPIFLDRLGAAIVSATRTPAKRLLWMGSAFLLLFLIVNGVAFFRPLRGFVDRIQNLLGWPVIALGAVCLVFWTLGSWFRKIANQSADFCEKVVEAQFAAQTKNLKSRLHDEDARILAARVIDPEIRLRSSDDLNPELYRRTGDDGSTPPGPGWLENRELVFLHNIRLLYQDYLDGSPFHRSDTKASVQLLGNLAITNLRRSHLGHLLREGRALDRLDLNRAGQLLGGPHLWFTYITRMIARETAMLLLDYNRHAIPAERLACSSPRTRRDFQNWLARRLRISPEEVVLPPLTVKPPEGETAAGAGEGAGTGGCLASAETRRIEAEAFLETVEFTAMDFLADGPDRDADIQARFGPQVAELVRRDRQQNVRRAFRSFPLHELPLEQRTINPYAIYQTYLSRGRIVFLPFLVAAGLGKALGVAVKGTCGVVYEILHPRVDQDEDIPSDTYWAALRKIHRMRKPAFMGSLWLRARFDVEYLGLQLPSAPTEIASQSLLESDLDFIGASRQDRIIAEQIRRGHQRRLEWIGRWLERFDWTFEALPRFLSQEIPYLTNRGGEALRALVMACVLDHDDITSLAVSIEGLERVMAHGADLSGDGRMLPPGLPDPVVNLRKLWYPVTHRRPLTDLFDLPCFPRYDSTRRRRIIAYLRRHHRAVRGWVKVVLGQGGADPWAVVRARMREVLLRTDLWSDEILVLRAVQTLTMLDVQHSCEMVWSLGGYTLPSALAMDGAHRGLPSDRRPLRRPPASAAELASARFLGREPSDLG